VSDDAPSLDIIYKLAETAIGGKTVQVMKFSEGKATLPGRKQVFRTEEAGAYAFDVIGLDGEQVPGTPLLEKFVSEGKIVKKPGGVEEARERAIETISKLPGGVKRLASPGVYPVHQSPGLSSLIDELRKKRE
jgi:nicotinate phosphoribosyltransferase